MCKLLHGKVFRHSLFSDETDTETTPPDDQKRKAKRQKTLPTIPSRSREPSLSRTIPTSRSLSISLEAEVKTTTNGKKRVLTREVSMSKGFKRARSSALPDLPPEPPIPVVKEKPKGMGKIQGLERTQSQVLVEDTPVKPIKQFSGKRPPPARLNTTVTRANGNSSKASSRKSSSPLDLGEGRTFATGTPIKSGPRTGLDRVGVDFGGDESEDDDEWTIGSPSVRRSLVSALTDEDARSGSP